MKRFIALAAVLGVWLVGATSASAAGAGYCWTISKSQIDPYVNSGQPNGSVDTLFLWFTSSTEGMSAAEMTLESIPPGQVLGFNVMNGYLNAGDATNLLLAVGGCPNAPVVAGSILILHFAPVAVCLGGANVTVDCSPNPMAWPHDRKSYADLGLPFCLGDTESFCPHYDSIEDVSWGRIKSTYR